MLVSALSNQQSFGTCIPVYGVYQKDKEGNVTNVPAKNIKGIATALVKRVRNINSREAEFFKNNIDTFDKNTEMDRGILCYKVASSSAGMGFQRGKEKIHVFFGDDLDTIRYYSNRFLKGLISAKELVDDIATALVVPKENRLKKTDTNEPMGLVLYTLPSGKSFKLNSLAFVKENGEIIKELPAELSKRQSQRLKELEEEKIFEEADENARLLQEYHEQKKMIKSEEEENEEPDLLSDDEFYD